MGARCRRVQRPGSRRPQLLRRPTSRRRLRTAGPIPATAPSAPLRRLLVPLHQRRSSQRSTGLTGVQIFHECMSLVPSEAGDAAEGGPLPACNGACWPIPPPDWTPMLLWIGAGKRRSRRAHPCARRPSTVGTQARHVCGRMHKQRQRRLSWSRGCLRARHTPSGFQPCVIAEGDVALRDPWALHPGAGLLRGGRRPAGSVRRRSAAFRPRCCPEAQNEYPAPRPALNAPPLTVPGAGCTVASGSVCW